ncbi:MAG: thiopeptide-type bacteriocin biosynthesis protein [Saprospiraceae bacterium]
MLNFHLHLLPQFYLIIEDEKFRWIFAVSSLDNYLAEFSFSLNEKKEFVSKLKDNFSKEFNIQNKFQRKSLNDHYRFHKKEIQLLFDQKHPHQNSINKILNHRSLKWNNTIKKIKNSYKEKSGNKINNLIASLIHMNINRLFRSEQRYQEFIIYNLLDKHYKSQIGRLKHQESVLNKNPNFK